MSVCVPQKPEGQELVCGQQEPSEQVVSIQHSSVPQVQPLLRQSQLMKPPQLSGTMPHVAPAQVALATHVLVVSQHSVGPQQLAPHGVAHASLPASGHVKYREQSHPGNGLLQLLVHPDTQVEQGLPPLSHPGTQLVQHIMQVPPPASGGGPHSGPVVGQG